MIRLSKTQKDELTVLGLRETRRALVSANKQDSRVYKRLTAQISALTPKVEQIQLGNKTFTLCALVGNKGGVVSTGVAWKAPSDTNREDVGTKIAYSRAIRNLVSKRLGISS